MNGFSVFQSRLIVTGYIETSTPLRVGAGKSTNATDSDNPVIKDVMGNPIIPGSSLKGAMRSYTEALLRSVKPNDPMMACDIFDPKAKCSCEPSEEEIRAYHEHGIDDIDVIYMDRLCWACRLFGSPRMASRLMIRDLTVASGFWGGTYLMRDGVAIDRDTGTAAARRKYDFEAVPASTRFNLTIQMDNLDDTELGLALLVLRALEKEQIQLGGARSRGLGWCKLVDAKYKLYTDPVALLLEQDGQTIDATDAEYYVKCFLEQVHRA